MRSDPKQTTSVLYAVLAAGALTLSVSSVAMAQSDNSSADMSGGMGGQSGLSSGDDMNSQSGRGTADSRTGRPSTLSEHSGVNGQSGVSAGQKASQSDLQDGTGKRAAASSQNGSDYGSSSYNMPSPSTSAGQSGGPAGPSGPAGTPDLSGRNGARGQSDATGDNGMNGAESSSTGDTAVPGDQRTRSQSSISGNSGISSQPGVSAASSTDSQSGISPDQTSRQGVTPGNDRSKGASDMSGDGATGASNGGTGGGY
jgi:hypothetical protein